MDIGINAQQLRKDWESLHAIPEIGFKEYKTSAYLKERLREMGYQVTPIAGTGLLARLDGDEPGALVGLRADMDALQFHNEDGSTEMIHACGHDAHCSMVLAAGELAVKRGLKKGTLYLLFQPAEETICGASRVIKDGGLPHFDALFGIHLRPRVEIPLGTATAELLHQATLPMTVTFLGRESHAARPQSGINALSAAADCIAAVDALRLDTAYSYSAKATNCTCYDNSHNVIPARCTVQLDLRAQTNALAKELVSRVHEIAESSARKVGCTTAFSQIWGYAAEYDPRLVRVCERAITETLGSVEPPLHTLGSEDFHAYHMEYGIPVAYMGLGADVMPGLHARNMHFDHSCMVPGAEILFRCVSQLLEFKEKQ